jgi:flagellar M-ring protein FliF
MSEESQKVIAQVREQWTKLSATARLVVGGILLGGGLVALALVFFARDNYGFLFRVNDAAETGDIVAALDAAKIPHRISGGGLLIEVPQDDVDRARILLAQQNLPKGGSIDFRIYDDPSPGWTRTTEAVNFQRALQGELERTIASIDTVSGARVHLTIPKKASFADQQVAPTASVTIRQRTGRELTEVNIRAIQHLVAAAVERLEAKDVVVVDSQGRLLSRGALSEIAGPTLDYKNDLERNLERNVTNLLERVMGLGGVQVSIEAEVDFSETKTQEEIYDPEQLALRRETTEEVVEGQGNARPQGLAGTVANQPGGADPSTANARASNRREVKAREYSLNRTVVDTKGPAATLKHLTISVLVDGKYTTPEDGGEPVFTPRSADELRELQTLVENAVGFNAARGDRIAISSKEFVLRSAFVDTSIGPSQDTPKWLPYAVGGGALLLVGAAFLLMRRRSKPVSVEVVRPGTKVAEAQRALAAAELGQLPEAEDASSPAMTIAALRSQVVEASEQSPERAAEVVKAWIRERDAA